MDAQIEDLVTQRDRRRLEGTHPRLSMIVTDIILPCMYFARKPMFVVEGRRTLERQQELWAKGRTCKDGIWIITNQGLIVTRCDGIKNPSNHQAKEDGFGHAVDLAFIDDPNTDEVETWDYHMPWSLYGAIAKLHGCSWGGDWPSAKIDRPHIELIV